MKKSSISLFALLAVIFGMTSAFTSKSLSSILAIANSARTTTFNPLIMGGNMTTNIMNYPGVTLADKADAYAYGAGEGFSTHCIVSSLTCFVILQDNVVVISRPGSYI